MQILLETGRLRLRQFTAADEDNLFELNSDPDVMRYISGGEPTPRAQIRDEILPFHARYYERFPGFGTWAAEARPAGEFLGWFHFRSAGDGADLGYRLRRAAWNRGYATEGSRALIRTGFADLGVQRVFAHAMAANAASRRVLAKCGLVLVPAAGPGRTGSAVAAGPEPGEVEYELTRAQWDRAERDRPGTGRRT
jgi:RimJ/RimL family protein N-acetyltransferase